MEESGAVMTLRDDLRAKLQKLRAAERTRRTAKGMTGIHSKSICLHKAAAHH